MEAVLKTHHTAEQAAAANSKAIRIKNPASKRGLLNPPSRAMSLTSHPLSASSAPFYPQSHQPPLLPLPPNGPTTTTHHHHHHQYQPHPPHALARSLSSSGVQLGRATREHHVSVSLTAKKSKPTKPAKRSAAATQSISEYLCVASNDNNNRRWGADPTQLAVGSIDHLSILSPPPSSLPLPKFPSMRSKLITCNAEASAAVDDGATNNLRQLLRLR